MSKEIQNILSKAIEIIKRPDNWLQNDEARNENDEIVESEDPTAVRYCLKGAIFKAALEMDTTLKSYTEAKDEVKETIKDETGISGEPIIDFFNDDYDITHQDVIEILNTAIIRLQTRSKQ